MAVCLSEFSSVRCLTSLRDTQRGACASKWETCSDQLQTEGRRPDRPMAATLSVFRGFGGVVWFRVHGHTQTQTITPENSHDLGRGSEGEDANSTSSVLLEKLIVCKLANKSPPPPKVHHRVGKASHLSLTPSHMNGTHSHPASFFKINFNIVLPSMSTSCQLSSLHVPLPNRRMHDYHPLTVKQYMPKRKLTKSDVWLTVHRNSVWIRKTN